MLTGAISRPFQIYFRCEKAGIRYRNPGPEFIYIAIHTRNSFREQRSLNVRLLKRKREVMNILGFGDNMQGMKKQIQVMQQKIASVQEELETKTVTLIKVDIHT